MKKTFATIIAALGMSVSPVSANELLEQHNQLWSSLQQVGITMSINSPIHCKGDKMGAYYYNSGLMVICQEQSTTMNGEQVEWTAEDLDTLRHESHHVVQDCVAGEIADGSLSTLFDNPDEWKEFVRGGLSETAIEGIIKTYSTGDNNGVVARELEAFSVASSVSADTIANKVIEMCSYGK